jgi:hypothetical protein
VNISAQILMIQIYGSKEISCCLHAKFFFFFFLLSLCLSRMKIESFYHGFAILKMKQTKKHTKIIKSFDGYDIARN